MSDNIFKCVKFTDRQFTHDVYQRALFALYCTITLCNIFFMLLPIRRPTSSYKHS